VIFYAVMICWKYLIKIAGLSYFIITQCMKHSFYINLCNWLTDLIELSPWICRCQLRCGMGHTNWSLKDLCKIRQWPSWQQMHQMSQTMHHICQFTTMRPTLSLIQNMSQYSLWWTIRRTFLHVMVCFSVTTFIYCFTSYTDAYHSFVRHKQ